MVSVLGLREGIARIVLPGPLIVISLFTLFPTERRVSPDDIPALLLQFQPPPVQEVGF